ncbi:zinc finger protein ZAT9-like [Cocos nucifera]|uniref:Zinc finger protein ZAT9-like n=1 Tax=Cocos nucifera TaxID=13894 RepID=A0A8K0NC64_COCNU|nr:zinc finger protein ZAT9-like [Cocos nucifera]
MERDRELKHCCKLCGKSFPCGRSLGGHMRSHLALNSCAEVEARLQSSRSSIGVGAGYDLRENPKKTWRLSDSGRDGSPRHDKLCKKCGKGFPSWKSLFGHMRCHPDKSRHNLEEGEEEEKELEGAWSAGGQSDNEVMIPRGRRRSRRVALIPASSTPVLELEKEQEDVALSLMMLSRDTGFWSSISLAAESDKNSVELENLGSEGDEIIGKGKKRSEFISSRYGDRRDEQKKVESDVSDDDGFVKDDELKRPRAYTLDTDEFEHADEASRKGSLKKKDLSCCLAELGRKTGFDQWHSGVGKYRKSGSMSEFGASKGDFSKVSLKRGRYECTTCNKFFPSYQALGGHRASHKRIKVLLASRTEGSSNSLETDASIKPALLEVLVDKNVGIDTSSEASKKVKDHECPICHKVFSSSQALGGHKKSHLVVSSNGGGLTHQTIVIQQQPPGMPDLLDLNIPAPTNEGYNNTDGNLKFRSWWVGRNHEREPLWGLISN